VAHILLDDSKVATVVRPLERFLVMAKFAFIPVVAISLSSPMIRSLFASSTSSAGEVALNLVGPALAVAYLVALQMTGLKGRADRKLARIHRKIALACNHDHAEAHSAGGVACRLTPDMFQAPVFDYRQQTRVVSKLAEACGAKESGQYWFVQGNSGTGKTRTGLRLIQRLIRDPELFELGTRCYLYDLSDSRTVQRKLLSHLGSGRHDDAVVVIDNFQLVEPKLLSRLTERLIEKSMRGGERLLVFLAREAGAWNLSPGRDVGLLSEAKAIQRHCKLEGPSSLDVVEEVAEIDVEASQLIGSMEAPGLASAAQLHLAQVMVHNRSLPPEAMDVIRLLAGDAGSVKSESVQMLALLSAVAMHRGTFSRRSLWRAIRVATRRASGTRLINVMRMRSTFRRFHRIGLVPKIQAGGTRYVFHEDIARQCIDTLFDDPRFAATFETVGTARLERLIGTPENGLRAWLVAAELGNQKALESQFEAALLQGAYQRMAQCLGRAKKRYGFHESTLLQLAILLDRIGEFALSRKLFTEHLDEELDRSRDLAVLFAVSRLEVNHQHDYKDDLDILLATSDPLVSKVGEYWKIHINAHRGIFEPDRLKQLTTEAYGRLGSQKSYWQLHSIVRMYFDSLRHLYLTGEYKAAAFAWQTDQGLQKYLRQMPTYEALNALYMKAHLVGHVFIPRLAIFGEPVSSGDATIAGLDPSEVTAVDELIVAAQQLYRQARDKFWLYGDREERYLQAEILNAAMIETGVNLSSLDQSLNEYEQFIVKGEQSMLASYPHLYRFRRDMLTYFQVRLGSDATNHTGADHHKQKARERLHRVSVLDSEIGNFYGQMRADLLSLLLETLTDQDSREMELELDQAKLAAMASRMGSTRYGFEQRLLRRLIERNSISMLELREIFRFYPFVNQ
jgi:hypothetical protein